MSWRDRYRAASYAGAPFLIDSHEFSGGRVGVVHSYPQRDLPFVEDTGRMPRRFTIRGFILGENYDQDRDRLVAQCEKRSPGFPNTVGRTLSHPYLGALQVFCTGYSIRERIGDGRMCTVTMSFVETSETVFPVKNRTGTADTDEAAVEVNDGAETAAAEEITTTGPESVRLATSRVTSEIAAALARLDVFSGAADDVAAYSDQITQLAANAVELSTSPATLAAEIRAALEAIFDIAGAPRAILFAYESLFGFSTSKASGISKNAKDAAANATALENLLLELATSGASRAAVRVPYESLTDALETRERLLAQFDTLADCSNDTVCLALPELLAAVVNGVPNPDEDLPRLETIELTEWEPALLTGWRLYADANRGEEIATRNGIPKAGFLPALSPLEVLVDA